MEERSQRRTRQSKASEPGPLTLADVEELDEHSEVDRSVIPVLRDLVKERDSDEGESSPEKKSAGPDGEGTPASNDGPRATQGAKDLAAKEGIALADVEGSGHEGPDGRRKITKSDVKKKPAEREASSS